MALNLSRRGVNLLSSLDAGVGHAFLAKRWTNTRPVVRGDGSVLIEIYNDAEGMTFHTKSNAPNSTKTYPVKGKDLLNYLLNGTKAHVIAARNARNPLQFTAVAGERQSRFAGSAVTEAGIAVGQFRNQKKPDTVIRINRVRHPGVVGNRFLHVARNRLEAAVASESTGLGARVTARLR